MQLKRVVVICIFCGLIVTVLLFCLYNYTNKRKAAADNPIEKLVNDALSIQYGDHSIELDQVFTNEFIQTISNNANFYKENLAPYKIIKRDYSFSKAGENDFKISVQIKDNKGSYIQVIHLQKDADGYLISNIEYDI